MSAEEILGTFYQRILYTRDAESWCSALDLQALRGLKLDYDLVDADSGEVLVEAGKKITPRILRQVAEVNATRVRIPTSELTGRFVAEDVINEETGEVLAEAGNELTEAVLAAMAEAGIAEIPVLRIDSNTGPYLRNTLAADKNSCREEALVDIYRVMRPGEPPTLGHRRGAVRGPVLRFRALRPVRGRPGEDERASQPLHRRRAGEPARAAQGRHPGDHPRASRPQGRQGARSTTSTTSATAGCAPSAN